MCITFLIQHQQRLGAEFPFVFAFNRDEHQGRVAESLRFQIEKGFKNIVCGIDVITGTTWFAFNKMTGDFACLTNFRTRRNQFSKRDYQSRGLLVMEYVKLNDTDVPKEKKMTYENFLAKLYSGIFKGFNLIFGNIFDNPDGKPGQLRYYQNQNVDPGSQKDWQAPRVLMTNRAHGLSNGDINKWSKVIDGRYAFF